MESEDLVIVRTYLTEPPAQVAKATLEGSGIEVMIESDDCGGMRPYFRFSDESGVHIIVRKEDKERADEVLKQAEIEDEAPSDKET